MKLILAAAANRIIVDQRTNQTSIIDIFEGLTAVSFPVVLANLMVFFHLLKEEGDPDTKEVLLKCFINEKEILTAPIIANFRDKDKTRAIIDLEGFVIPDSGELIIKLMDGDNDIGKITAPITKIDTSPTQVKQEAED